MKVLKSRKVCLCSTGNLLLRDPITDPHLYFSMVSDTPNFVVFTLFHGSPTKGRLEYRVVFTEEVHRSVPDGRRTQMHRFRGK